jgi:hypothetical protein
MILRGTVSIKGSSRLMRAGPCRGGHSRFVYDNFRRDIRRTADNTRGTLTGCMNDPRFMQQHEDTIYRHNANIVGYATTNHATTNSFYQQNQDATTNAEEYYRPT